MALWKYKLADGWHVLYGGILANILRKDKNLSDVEDRAAAREALELTGNSNTTHYHDSRYMTRTETQEHLENQMMLVNSALTAAEERINQLAAQIEESLNKLFKKGMIIDWYGTADQVPDGWVICDGKHGTPDLRDKFVVGAGLSYALKATGGEATHTLTVSESPIHNHSATIAQSGNHHHWTMDRKHTASFLVHNAGVNLSVQDIYYGDDGRYNNDWFNAYTSYDGTHGHGITINNAGNGQAHENRPPYYALYKIMYVGT